MSSLENVFLFGSFTASENSAISLLSLITFCCYRHGRFSNANKKKYISFESYSLRNYTALTTPHSFCPKLQCIMAGSRSQVFDKTKSEKLKSFLSF